MEGWLKFGRKYGMWRVMYFMSVYMSQANLGVVLAFGFLQKHSQNEQEGMTVR